MHVQKLQVFTALSLCNKQTNVFEHVLFGDKELKEGKMHYLKIFFSRTFGPSFVVCFGAYHNCHASFDASPTLTRCELISLGLGLGMP